LPEARVETLTRVWHVLRGWREVDPRTASQAAILHGSYLGRALFTERQDQKALRHFGDRDVLGRAVRSIIDSSDATAAAVGIAVVSAASSPGS
jgi:hypothetical protein